jgi:hypothetical protein
MIITDPKIAPERYYSVQLIDLCTVLIKKRN